MMLEGCGISASLEGVSFDIAAIRLHDFCGRTDAGIVVSVAGEAAEQTAVFGPGGLCEVAPARCSSTAA